MLTSILIGQERVEKTMILSFWPCNVRTVGAIMQALPFHYAGVQQRVGAVTPGRHDSATRVSRKQLLAALDDGKYGDYPEVWFLLHKQEQAPISPLASPTGGLAVYLNNGLADFFIPPRRSLVEKMIAALVARGDTTREDDAAKTENLVRRTGKMRANEALIVHWLDDKMLVRTCRRDEIESRNIAALASGAPPLNPPVAKTGTATPSPWLLHRFMDPADAPPKKA